MPGAHATIETNCQSSSSSGHNLRRFAGVLGSYSCYLPISPCGTSGGVSEIGKLLGVSRQHADQLVRTKGFPDPIFELTGVRIWERASVVRWTWDTTGSIPWATVELELEELSKEPPSSAAYMYRYIWMITRLQALGREPNDVLPTREFAHKQALASARWIDPTFDVTMPTEVDDED
jgi:hypothetical protein